MTTTNRSSSRGPARGTSTTEATNLQASIETIAEIDTRMKALETQTNLRGQLCLDMTLGRHAGESSGLTWQVRIYQYDGRREIATGTGGKLDAVINRVMKDAWKTLRTGTGQQQRVA